MVRVNLRVYARVQRLTIAIKTNSKYVHLQPGFRLHVSPASTKHPRWPRIANLLGGDTSSGNRKYSRRFAP